jgi:hypothetical protein
MPLAGEVVAQVSERLRGNASLISGGGPGPWVRHSPPGWAVVVGSAVQAGRSPGHGLAAHPS